MWYYQNKCHVFSKPDKDSLKSSMFIRVGEVHVKVWLKERTMNYQSSTIQFEIILNNIFLHLNHTRQQWTKQKLRVDFVSLRYSTFPHHAFYFQQWSLAAFKSPTILALCPDVANMLYSVCKQKQNLQFAKKYPDVVLTQKNLQYASDYSTSPTVSPLLTNATEWWLAISRAIVYFCSVCRTYCVHQQYVVGGSKYSSSSHWCGWSIFILDIHHVS